MVIGIIQLFPAFTHIPRLYEVFQPALVLQEQR